VGHSVTAVLSLLLSLCCSSMLSLLSILARLKRWNTWWQYWHVSQVTNWVSHTGCNVWLDIHMYGHVYTMQTNSKLNALACVGLAHAHPIICSIWIMFYGLTLSGKVARCDLFVCMSIYQINVCELVYTCRKQNNSFQMKDCSLLCTEKLTVSFHSKLKKLNVKM